MTESELKIYNQIMNRIETLETEVYALFEAQWKRINPVKRFIKTISQTKKKPYEHDEVIVLTLEDIRLLQDARMREISYLKTLIKEGE